MKPGFPDGYASLASSNCDPACFVRRSPSPQPSPQGEGDSLFGQEQFVALRGLAAARIVLPLLGERVGVRGNGASDKLRISRFKIRIRNSPDRIHTALLCLLILVTLTSGCTTKSKANAAARAAYSAGQQQATERILQSRNSVTVMGPLRNPLVPWTQIAGGIILRAVRRRHLFDRTLPRPLRAVWRNQHPVIGKRIKPAMGLIKVQSIFHLKTL